MSNILNKAAIRAINRIGDILIPKNGEFPSYSELGGVEHVDEVLEYAEEEDIKDLNRVLAVLSIMPGFVLRWLVKKMANSGNAKGPAAPTIRMLDFGLRGILFSTYYSEKPGSSYKGKIPMEIIGYKIVRIPLDSAS